MDSPKQNINARTKYRPKESIGLDFTIGSDDVIFEKSRRHYENSPGESKPTVETPHGKKHINTPNSDSHIVFETPAEPTKTKPFTKPRPNTKPEFHSKKYAPSRPILKPHNESSIVFGNYPTPQVVKKISERLDPASLPAAGTKSGFYGVR